jgi:hypothetical protein
MRMWRPQSSLQLLGEMDHRFAQSALVRAAQVSFGQGSYGRAKFLHNASRLLVSRVEVIFRAIRLLRR